MLLMMMLMMMNVTPRAKLNGDLNVVDDDDDSHVSCKVPLVLRKP